MAGDAVGGIRIVIFYALPVKGIVKGFGGEHVVLETDDDEIRIPLEQIITAKLVIDF